MVAPEELRIKEQYLMTPGFMPVVYFGETKEKELGKHVFIAPQTTGSLPNVVDHIIAYSVNDIQTVEFVENRSIWESKAIKFRPTKVKKYYDDGRNNGQDEKSTFRDFHDFIFNLGGKRDGK